MKKRLLKFSTAAIILVAAGVLYYLIVSFTGFAIPCVFRKITGLYCPGCGVTGMLTHILRLDFKGAFECNQVLFVISPFILYLLGKMLYGYIRYGRLTLKKFDTVLTFVLIGILLVFGVIRNLPPFDFLSAPSLRPMRNVRPSPKRNEDGAIKSFVESPDVVIFC